MVVAEKPSYGGQIYKALLQEFKHFQVDDSTVYRCLQEHLKKGCVQTEWLHPPKGPARKIYSITEVGYSELEEWHEDINMRKAYFEVFMEKYERVKGERNGLGKTSQIKK